MSIFSGRYGPADASAKQSAEEGELFGSARGGSAAPGGGAMGTADEEENPYLEDTPYQKQSLKEKAAAAKSEILVRDYALMGSCNRLFH